MKKHHLLLAILALITIITIQSSAFACGIMKGSDDQSSTETVVEK